MLKDFYEGLQARLDADEALRAWSETHFAGRRLSFLAGIQAGSVNTKEMPAVVIDNGMLREMERPGTAVPATLGGKRMDVNPSLIATFVFREPDPLKLFARRMELPDLVMQAVMRDGRLGGKIAYAYVSAWDWLNVEEPLALFAATVTGLYQLAV